MQKQEIKMVYHEIIYNTKIQKEAIKCTKRRTEEQKACEK